MEEVELQATPDSPEKLSSTKDEIEYTTVDSTIKLRKEETNELEQLETQLFEDDSTHSLMAHIQDKQQVKILPHLQRVENFRKTKSVMVNFQSEIVLHSALFLFVISAMRLGPSLMYGGNFQVAYFLEMKMTYGWDDLYFYMTLPYFVGSSFTFLSIFIFRFLSIPFLALFINSRNSDSEKYSYVQVVINNLKNPYISSIFILIALSITQTGVTLSIVYSSPVALVIFRLLFGLIDAFQRYYAVFFVAKIFSNQNFCLAVGFVYSVERIITGTLDSIKAYVKGEYFLILSIIGCLFSILASASLKTLVSKNFNIFKANFEEEFLIVSRLNNKRMLIFLIIGFSIFHLSLVFCHFTGLNIFPLNFGGYGIWVTKMKLNPFQNDLFLLTFTILLFKSLMIPLIGTILDTEYVQFEFKNKNITEIIQKHKLHLRTIVIGLLGTSLSQLLYFYTDVYPKSNYYYFLIVLFGISSSCLEITLISFPMLVIRNIVPEMFATYYSFYSVLYFLFSDASRLVHYFVINTRLNSLVFFYIVFGYILLISLTLTLSYIFSFIINQRKKSKEKKYTIPIKKLDKSISTIDLDFDKKLRNDGYHRKYWKLLYYIPIELSAFFVNTTSFLLLFSLAVISFVYYFSTGDFNFVFLPILSIMFSISILFSFSRTSRKMFGITFFHKTRKIFGIIKRSAIGTKILENYQLSIAIWKLKTSYPHKLDALKKNDSNFMTFVVPDHIVLENSSDRLKIYDLQEGVEIDDNESMTVCSNGILVVNNKEKNIFDFQTRMNDVSVERKGYGRFFDSGWFKQNFYFVMYGGYIMVFALPIFINSVYCIENCDIPLFSTNGSAVSLVVSFFCGFFLMYPFVNAWKEVFLIIDQLSNQAIIMKKLTSEYFDNLDDFTIEKIQEWDKIMAHVMDLVFVRATYIKYTFIIAWSSSKFSSILFGIFGLFLKTKITTLFVSLVFLVILLEIAVIFYLILPGAICTMELNGSVNTLLGVEKNFASEIMIKKRNDLRDTLELFQTKCRFWQAQVQLGYSGYWFRVESLHTSWGISSSDVRTSILAFCFTLTPALITFFLNNA
eukprot:gene5-4256_t